MSKIEQLIQQFCPDFPVLKFHVKELLEAKGMSQTEPAHRLGKCFNTVNLYAVNRVQPPVAVLYQKVRVLHTF